MVFVCFRFNTSDRLQGMSHTRKSSSCLSHDASFSKHPRYQAHRREFFSLISSLSTVTPPGRWNRKEVLCYGKNKEDLTGICKNSEAWTQATWLKSPFKQSLANFSRGLDAVVFVHLLWSGIVVVGWELSLLPT